MRDLPVADLSGHDGDRLPESLHQEAVVRGVQLGRDSVCPAQQGRGEGLGRLHGDQGGAVQGLDDHPGLHPLDGVDAGDGRGGGSVGTGGGDDGLNELG